MVESKNELNEGEQTKITQIEEKLIQERSKRVRPFFDDKSQTDLNAFILDTLIGSAIELGDNNLKNDVYYLRNLEEAKKIKEIVSNKNKITIIGGGFIGLEIASSLSQLQKKVTVIEIGNQLMGRIIPKQIADLVQNTHIEPVS